MNSKPLADDSNHDNSNFKSIASILLKQTLWLTWALTLLICCLGISWQVSKSVNFSYSFWYQQLSIDKTIANNVLKNIHGKRDFPINDANLHQEKFIDIVNAIHQQGRGLKEISYQNAQGQVRQFLTVSEIQHLQDVANLLDKVVKISWVSVLCLISIFFIYYHNSITKSYAVSQVASKRLSFIAIATIPSAKQKLMSVFASCLLIVAILSLWGFTSVFYYLHTVVFPADHQWFFYYYDSLMSTIMKAPEIFAAIAGQLAIVALFLAVVIDVVVSRYIRHAR